jgi:hypothetical protein
MNDRLAERDDPAKLDPKRRRRFVSASPRPLFAVPPTRALPLFRRPPAALCRTPNGSPPACRFAALQMVRRPNARAEPVFGVRRQRPPPRAPARAPKSQGPATPLWLRYRPWGDPGVSGVQGFRGSEVQGFRGSEVPGFGMPDVGHRPRRSARRPEISKRRRTSEPPDPEPRNREPRNPIQSGGRNIVGSAALFGRVRPPRSTRLRPPQLHASLPGNQIAIL